MNIAPSPDDETQTLIALERLGQYLRSQMQRGGTAARLSPTQILILRHIVRKGAAGVTALAEALGVAQPTVTDAVQTLRRKGLVARGQDPRDRRAAPVVVTDAGSAMLAGLTAMPSALDRALAGIGTEERTALRRALASLIRGLQDQGAIPAQRLCLTCAHFRPNVHPDPARPHHCQFVDAAFGDGALRVDCGDHEPVDLRARAAPAARVPGPAG